ncbi:serine hydrolase domain-containing protein [Geodermatophilus sp. URMC 63]
MSGGCRQRGRARLGALLLVAALAACTPTAGSPSPVATGAEDLSSDLASRVARSEDLLERTLSPDEPGCSAAVGVEGEVVWAAARGRADLATGRSLTPSTTFDIASVSKQFTATAALLLVQEGRLSLDDPLSRWMPDLPAWSNETTIDQLLHHTSAIPDYTPRLAAGHELSEPTSQEQAIAVVARIQSLDDRVRGTFEYSNSNYLLLAEVVQHAAQQPLAEFVRTRIFEPLALDMVLDPYGASPDNTDQSSARSYQTAPPSGAWEPAGSRWEQIGDGSIQKTPTELVRWADNYRTGRLGGSRLLDAQLNTTTTAAGPDGDRYAAGITVTRDGALTHNGLWAGFTTTFDVSADRRTAVTVSCNGIDPRSGPDIKAMIEELRAEWATA